MKKQYPRDLKTTNEAASLVSNEISNRIFSFLTAQSLNRVINLSDFISFCKKIEAQSQLSQSCLVLNF